MFVRFVFAILILATLSCSKQKAVVEQRPPVKETAKEKLVRLVKNHPTKLGRHIGQMYDRGEVMLEPVWEFGAITTSYLKDGKKTPIIGVKEVYLNDENPENEVYLSRVLYHEFIHLKMKHDLGLAYGCITSIRPIVEDFQSCPTDNSTMLYEESHAYRAEWLMAVKLKQEEGMRNFATAVLLNGPTELAMLRGLDYHVLKPRSPYIFVQQDSVEEIKARMAKAEKRIRAEGNPRLPTEPPDGDWNTKWSWPNPFR